MQQIHLSSLAPSRILDFPFKNKEHLEKLPQVLKNHLSMSPFHNCTIVIAKLHSRNPLFECHLQRLVTPVASLILIIIHLYVKTVKRIN